MHIIVMFNDYFNNHVSYDNLKFNLVSKFSFNVHILQMVHEHWYKHGFTDILENLGFRIFFEKPVSSFRKKLLARIIRLKEIFD